MKITLDNVGKKFNKEWIFNHVNQEFTTDDKTVILGSNGSGKSTLLKTISGFLIPNNGKISYNYLDKTIDENHIYKYIAYTSPYIGVYEEYTISELLSFYKRLKPLKSNIKSEEFIEKIELSHAKNKEIKFFSSGMKQRVKLGLAIMSDTPFLLLDEPTVNLDKNAIMWYQNLIMEYAQNRIIFIASNNQEEEYFFCDKKIKIEDYK